MAVAEPVFHPYRFSRAAYYAIADHLDPALRYELLDGTIYAMRPAKPPHAGVVDFFKPPDARPIRRAISFARSPSSRSKPTARP